MLGVSLFISCKNKIQCVCVKKKIKMVCNFVLLSMFEIFIVNPNQKREKTNQNILKKKIQNFQNLTKFM